MFPARQIVYTITLANEIIFNALNKCTLISIKGSWVHQDMNYVSIIYESWLTIITVSLSLSISVHWTVGNGFWILFSENLPPYYMNSNVCSKYFITQQYVAIHVMPMRYFLKIFEKAWSVRFKITREILENKFTNNSSINLMGH